jgi:hypothetical protein
MILGSGAWSTVLDTAPAFNFECKTDITVDFRSTSSSELRGVCLYVNVAGGSALPFGNLLFEVRRNTATTQDVRVWDAGTNTLLETFSGFGLGMIHMEFTVDVNAGQISVHTVTDGVVNNSGSMAFGLNGVTAGYPYVTFTTQGQSGEVDYVKIVATPDAVPSVDYVKDCKIDLADFADLASRYDPTCN